MAFDVVVLGGRIFSSTRSEVADIGIREGVIAEIGDLAGKPAASVVDAAGLAVLPGLIDTQVHFREPGMEHKEDLASGARAAVLGGVTSVLEMPNTLPTTSTAEALADKLTRASGRMACNYGFFVGATTDNWADLPQLERLPGTPGVKMFMGSSTGTLLVPDDEHVEKVLSHGVGRVAVHSEDHGRLEARKSLLSAEPHPREHPEVRDAETARLCTERLLAIAEKTGRPVHVLHISTADELPMLAAAKGRGQRVTCEVTPQHLWFAAPECYERLGSLVQMNPPVRGAAHRDALRKALETGLFDVIGSDHAPHTLEEKGRPYPQSPSGMPGVQTSLSVLLTLGREVPSLDVHTVVRLMAENAAALYGMAGKGRVEIGFDADLALVDLDAEFVVEKSWLASKCGWSPYEGERLRGRPVGTLVRGREVVRESRLVDGAESAGQAIRFHLGAQRP